MKYLKNVVSLNLDSDKCTNCKKCIDVCPHQVLAMSSDKKLYIADRDRCIECGACQKNCPFDAIKVDAGVGCAAAYIQAMISGKEEACCGGDDKNTGCCS